MRRVEKRIGENRDVRGWSQVATVFNCSGFGEQQVRVGAERGIGRCGGKGKGQQWVGRSA